MIQVSPNHRFLQVTAGPHQEPAPFFWLADTAWELFHRTTREEAAWFLGRRAAMGFNVIQAVAIAEFGGDVEPNRYGEAAIEARDPMRPNPSYFDYVDFVVNECNRLGMTMALLPTWGSWVVKAAFRPKDIPLFTEQNARAYGRFLGDRYKGANIVWVLGGDRTGENVVPVWRAMAAGIKEGGSTAPMTWHPAGEARSSTFVHHEAWLDFNMIQSGHARKFMANHAMVADDYAKSPIKPILDAEPAYELHPIHWNHDNGHFTDYDVRLNAYWNVFSGGCGHTYGCQNIWQFANEALYPLVAAKPVHWQECVDLPGAHDMRHLKNLMASRPYFTRIPDQSVILEGQGQASDHVVATRDGTPNTKNATYLMAFRPIQKRVLLDTTVLPAKILRLWMYDPREGIAHLISEAENPGQLAMPILKGGSDWIAVIDDAAANYPRPGTPCCPP